MTRMNKLQRQRSLRLISNNPLRRWEAPHTMAARRQSRIGKKPHATDTYGEQDLGDIFDETAKRDALEVKLGAAAKHVKECHGLAREALMRLTAARLATSPSGAVRHDLERVAELAQEIHGEAQNALGALVR